ncbi:glycoside hydrolase family 3 C-terminal domain-containing protein [Streptomyces azureus]|uniref:glycoside hydrolase family 3 C-terminal domain-containing protein n=1 Tax=Streptomyces azureus TaxID=146537 RepID=UPI003C2BAA73
MGPEGRRLALALDLTVVDAGGYGRFVTAQLRHAPPGATPYEEIAEAVAAAQAADVAVVVVGTNEEVESEGWDRTALDLPGHQNDLVRKVIAANPRTIVVVNAGAPVLLPWADEAPVLLWAWLPGQEAGHALADVLLGRTEPSGRLPWTLPARTEDVSVPDARPRDGIVDYSEGVHVGHRAWDRAGLVPAFPFGHGLGWTRWTYESVTLSPSPVSATLPSPAGGDGLNLTVALTNTGPRAGREVVQVYLEPPQDGSDRPVRLLAGFAAVQAEAGARVTAEVHVPARAFRDVSRSAGTVDESRPAPAHQSLPEEPPHRRHDTGTASCRCAHPLCSKGTLEGGWPAVTPWPSTLARLRRVCGSSVCGSEEPSIASGVTIRLRATGPPRSVRRPPRPSGPRGESPGGRRAAAGGRGPPCGGSGGRRRTGGR